MVSLETAILSFKHALADFNPAVSQYRKTIPRKMHYIHFSIK